MGAILDAARADSKKYVKEGGFESDITLTNPSNTVTIATKGFASKHHISFDTDGTLINTKNAHICLDEEALTALDYPFRNDCGEVALKDHKIDVSDSSGAVKKYIVKENYPDETLGLIVCILGDFEC